MGSREEILRRIGEAKVESVTARRAPVVPTLRNRTEILDQFAEYVEEYRATVTRISESEIAEHVTRLQPKSPVLAPADLPKEWVSGLSDVRWDWDFSIQELDACQSVVSGSALGIAETGTIVLDAGFAQGPRRLSLIPDHHIVLVFESQVVDSIPEAVERLAPAIAEGRPLTWISGPSATSDIELSRVEGVHGPRRLDVLLISDR